MILSVHPARKPVPNQQDATRLRLESDQKELDHIQSEIKQITPDLEKVCAQSSPR